MPDGYIEPPVVTDAEDLLARIVDHIEATYPGWTPADGNLETILGEAFASVASDVQDTARAQADEQFRTFGTTVAGIPSDEDAPASVTSTWTMVDDTGYTIPVGTQVGIPGPAGLVPFVTIDEIAVAPGDTATTAGEVILEAVDTGADGNALTGTPVLLDTLAYVSGVVLVGATEGGSDAEDRDAYLDRLAAEYRLMSPRPILPDDFAVLLVNRLDGVARALAIDGYNPGDATYDNERTVSVAAHDEAGDALDPLVAAAGEALLEAMREANFIVHVIDPTYTAVTVVATVKALPGFETVDVDAEATAALTAYLSPAAWGSPTFLGDTTNPGWIDTPVVRLFEVAEVLNRVDGVNYVSALTINGSAADLSLTGVAPLPTVGTITVTVTAA